MDDFFVSETPGVCGGYPCIRHMRVPVRCIVEHHRAFGSIEGTEAMYPMVSAGDVAAALAWYAAHPERVDEDIARNRAAWERLTGRTGD